jgi:hypothetical protein
VPAFGKEERMSVRTARPLERFAWITLVLLLSGGTAYALDGQNTVFTDDVVNGEIRSADVADDSTAFALRGVDIKNESLTGADVRESTLAQVPEALTAVEGGLGREAHGGGCNPSDTNRLTCATVAMTLSAPGRVLLIGRVRAIVDDGQTVGYGSCNFGTNFSGPIAGSSVEIFTDDHTLEQVPMMIVTPVIGADDVSFGIDCNQEALGGGIRYDFVSLAAVALSAD